MAKKKLAAKPSVKKQKRGLKPIEVDKAALTAAALGSFLLATEVSAAEDAKSASEPLQDQNLLQAQAELSAELDPAALAVEDLPELTELGADLPLEGEALPELAAELPEANLDGMQLSQASPDVVTAPGVDGKTVMSDAGGAGGGAGNAGAASGTAAGSAAEAGAAAGAGGAAGAGLPGIAAFSSIPAGLVAGGLGLVAVAGASGGGGGGVGGLAGGLTSVAKGLVVDGNVRDAVVFFDADADGVLDPDEVSSKTGKDGSYTLSGYADPNGIGRIVVLAGGVDVLTGQTVGMMITPHGYTNVSPLTTLLAASGLTQEQLKAKLNIPDSIDLNNYDPLKDMESDNPFVRAAAEKAFTISQQVYAVLQTAATLQANGGAVDAADITNIAKAMADAIMSSTGGDSLSIIQEATQAAVTAAANGDQDLADSVAAALTNVNSAIQTAYTNVLADAINSRDSGDKATAVSVAAVSQSALLEAVASGDTSTLGLLSSPQGLQNLADLYKTGIKDNLDHGGTGTVNVSAPVTLTIDEADTTTPTGPYTIVDSADNIANYLSGPAGTILTGAIGVVATSVDPITMAQAVDLIADFPNISFQNKTLAPEGALSLTMAEAAPLIGHHLKFDANDTNVVLEFTDGQLDSVIDSALNLGVLGVDVLKPLSGEVTLTTAQATAAVITGHMKFDSDADVTVNVTQGELNMVLTTPGAADALGAAGIDELGAPDGPLSVTTLQAEGLVHAGLEFADSADVALGVTNSSGHTFLNTSLKELQHLGIDQVGLAGGVAEIALDLGDGAWGSGSLPEFAESYHVDLNFDDSQLQDIIAHKAALVGANIDELNATDGTVSLTMAQANTLLGIDGHFTAGSDIGFDADNLVTLTVEPLDVNVSEALSKSADLAELGVDQLHVTGGVLTASDADLHTMAEAGLVFDTDHDITAAVSSSATHMQTSLQKLQHLGVDAVHSVGVADFKIDLGDVNQINFGALPTFDSGDHVTLSLSADAGDYLFDNPDLFSDLSAAGIDALYINDSDVRMSLDELDTVRDSGLQFSANNDVTLEVESNDELASHIPELTDLQLMGVDHLDGGITTNPLVMNAAAANMLVHAGIDFTEDSVVHMNVDGAGTHLSSTLKDLQNLNVDMVTGALGTDLVVDLGSGTWTDESLPNFAGGLEVTLNAGANQLEQVANHIDGLTNHGIDSIQIHGTVTELTGLDEDLVATAGVDGYTLDVTEADLDGLAALIPNLPHVGGVHVDKVDFAGFAGHASQLHVDANLAQAMHEAGLSFEAADHISLDIQVGSGHGTSFATSAEALHSMGIDDVTVRFDNSGPVDLHALSHFDSALDVTLDLSEIDQNNLPTLDAAAGTLLESLGIDNLEFNVDTDDLAVDPSSVLGALNQIHNVMGLGAEIDLNGNGNLDASLGSLFEGLTGGALSDNYADLINALSESGVTEMTVESGTVDVSDSLLGALAESGMLHAVGNDSNITIDATASGDHLYTTLKDIADLDVDGVQLAHSGNVYINLGALGQNGALAEIQAMLENLDQDIFSGTGTPTLVLDARTAAALSDANGHFNTDVMSGLEHIGIREVAVLVGHNESTNIVAQSPTANAPEVKLIGQDMDPTLFDELHHPRH